MGLLPWSSRVGHLLELLLEESLDEGLHRDASANGEHLCGLVHRGIDCHFQLLLGCYWANQLDTSVIRKPVRTISQFRTTLSTLATNRECGHTRASATVAATVAGVAAEVGVPERTARRRMEQAAPTATRPAVLAGVAAVFKLGEPTEDGSPNGPGSRILSGWGGALPNTKVLVTGLGGAGRGGTIEDNSHYVNFLVLASGGLGSGQGSRGVV